MPKVFKESDCPECPDEGLPGWMGTFADMMTLLFAFFVLLFSMSTLDPVKMAMMAEEMSDVASGGKEESEGDKPPMKSQAQVKADLKDIVEELDENVKSKVKVSSDVNGVALEMDGDICFAGGTVDMHEEMMEILDIAAKLLMSNSSDMRPIFIQGHSDNQPVTGKLKEQYPTNWELSSARAAVVVNYLINAHGISSTRLRAMGFSDIWPSGVTFMDMRKAGFVDEAKIAELNASPDLMAKNRRIKIIFTPS